jgi:1-acyl-sn-glycerol-3-phosphate acyltransferase
MFKLLWYIYFALYLIFISIKCTIKLFFLKKKSNEIADRYVYETARNISKHVLKITKTKTCVKGIENIPKEPCIFVCNHQAIFDAFLLVANISQLTGFMAKKEIKGYPLIGTWIKAMHSVFIDRQNVREGMKAINEGVENIRKGYSMIIFPEGTRSLNSEMGEFKKGSMKLALKSKVPIVPITVDGTYRVVEVGKQVRGHFIKMIVHEPIYIDKISEDDKKNLSQILHDIIEKGIADAV